MPGKKEVIKFGAAWLAYKRSGERFRWLGYSEGCVGLTYETDSTDMMVDQTTSPIRTLITSETLTAEFPAVEATLDNFALAFPGAKRSGNTLHIFAAVFTGRRLFTVAHCTNSVSLRILFVNSNYTP